MTNGNISWTKIGQKYRCKNKKNIFKTNISILDQLKLEKLENQQSWVKHELR